MHCYRLKYLQVYNRVQLVHQLAASLVFVPLGAEQVSAQRLYEILILVVAGEELIRVQYLSENQNKELKEAQ